MVPSAPDARGSVDVVVPVRNGATTILSTLATALTQSSPPRRVIVVDDGSTDDTAYLVSRLNHPQIEIITTARAGVSHARNAGVRASRAQYVAFLDADDQWHPEKLERQLRVFADNPGAIAVYCGRAVLQPSGAVTCVQTPRLRGRVFEAVLAGGFIGCSSSIVVRRDALLWLGGYDETLRSGEDTDLHLRLAHYYAIDYAPEILAYIVETPGSVTRRPMEGTDASENLLQVLSIYETWSQTRVLSFRLLQHYRKRIVLHATRTRYGRYGRRWMLRFRAELQGRSPTVCRLLWRNHAAFLGCIALAVLAWPFHHLVRWSGLWRTGLRGPGLLTADTPVAWLFSRSTGAARIPPQPSD